MCPFTIAISYSIDCIDYVAGYVVHTICDCYFVVVGEKEQSYEAIIRAKWLKCYKTHVLTYIL